MTARQYAAGCGAERARKEMKFTDWLWDDRCVTVDEFEAMSEARQTALLEAYLENKEGE